ncbi:MAG TPA: hypothetical protein VFG47_20930, partial [Geminicoccaceae bacterium]|nr:hypothetical protein [Geminicoccaceae bacterium]
QGGGGAAGGAGAARGAAAHQRLGERPAPAGGQAQDLWRHALRRQGRDRRDAFLGLRQTRGKLGGSFWDYLGHRPGVPGAEAPADLPDLVRLRPAPA